MSGLFQPTPGYRVFLAKLVQTREDRGFTTVDLAEYLGLTTQQIEAYEAGEKPLGFIEVRTWLRALDMPFVVFTAMLDEALDANLRRDERVGDFGDETIERFTDGKGEVG